MDTNHNYQPIKTNCFEKIELNKEDFIFVSKRPVEEFKTSLDRFEEIWKLHPNEFHDIKIHGKNLKTPRWQQSYGKNYRYTGSVNNALPIPKILKIFHDWSIHNVDNNLNGLLLNWYDGSLGHYIGMHRDDIRDLKEGSPIVTISLGEERIFRFRPWKEKGFKDIVFQNDGVIVIPWLTNLKWTHEVPKFARYQGKRISITLRSYN